MNQREQVAGTPQQGPFLQQPTVMQLVHSCPSSPFSLMLSVVIIVIKIARLPISASAQRYRNVCHAFLLIPLLASCILLTLVHFNSPQIIQRR